MARRYLTSGSGGGTRVSVDGVDVTTLDIDSSAILAVDLANQTSPPAIPVGGGTLYAQDGSLKFRGSSGTISTIAPA